MDEKKSKTDKEAKAKRLAEQLRTNLRRRKGQVNSLRHGKADKTSGLPAAHTDNDVEN